MGGQDYIHCGDARPDWVRGPCQQMACMTLENLGGFPSKATSVPVQRSTLSKETHAAAADPS